MKASFASEPGAVPEIRRRTQEIAERAGLGPNARDDLLVAVSEAATNAVLHSRSPRLEVEWKRSRDRIIVSVRDEGTFEEPAEAKQRGWGLHLIGATTDDVVLRPGTAQRPGTEVRLVKRITA
ncbi:MAG TPA: ATP-binding protein [Actinomycetota bacterium]|nr:ATP-binding protein [Actinomycetota bacterium]